MTSSKRLVQLDAVRAIGVLLIISYHTAYRFPPGAGDFIGRGLRVVGFLGVDLFFALSGFLIGTILAKPEARTDIVGFFRKRFFRIVPIYIVAILVFAAADAALNDARQISNLWITLFFLTGYLIPFQGEAVPYTITWSLSVEVAAYLFLGLLAWRAWTHFRFALVVVVLVSLFLRVWLALGVDWSDAAIGVFPPARLDAIAFGALAASGLFARLTAGTQAAFLYGAFCLALMVAFRFAVWIPHFIATVGYTLFGFSAALWIAALAKSPPPRSFHIRALGKIGLVSYFIYLFHIFVIEALIVVDGMAGGLLSFWSAFASASLLTFAAALVSWRFFESPLIRFAHSADRPPRL